jgi:hypothetical protein
MARFPAVGFLSGQIGFVGINSPFSCLGRKPHLVVIQCLVPSTAKNDGLISYPRGAIQGFLYKNSRPSGNTELPRGGRKPVGIGFSKQGRKSRRCISFVKRPIKSFHDDFPREFTVTAGLSRRARVSI